MPEKHDKTSLPYGGSFAIMDEKILVDLQDIAHCDSEQFCSTYRKWIVSSKLNTFKGLDLFPFSVYSNATTEAFDKFYIRNNKRRFRCFRGEYMYHRVVWRNSWPDWCFIEDSPIDKNDAVIISLPFSDTGDKHELTDVILKMCTDLKVPVLLDCAYFGVCHDIVFDFTFDCITDITFSLSKVFPLAYSRIGMRLTKIDDDDGLFMVNKINYINQIGAALGIKLMKKYSADFIVEKYKLRQQQICNDLGVNPSKTVLFGIDNDNRYPEYNRGTRTNRLGLHKYLNV